ncbi:hypothetical protein T10_11719 [Trichinella papuae]|uniref:Uncharacterized protein n=1 Tax=Trichinella papuae TaxID=268474 RepID=A0A0V1M2M4_9BILA|nr:hypothetical protein T10_11719 [Trichinella papuae]
MHAKWFLALHYANKDDLKSVMVHLFVRLPWQVAILILCGSAVKPFHLTFKIYEDINNEEKKKFKRGRHEAECRRYEVEEKKTEGACGYLSIPILLVSAKDR